MSIGSYFIIENLSLICSFDWTWFVCGFIELIDYSLFLNLKFNCYEPTSTLLIYCLSMISFLDSILSVSTFVTPCGVAYTEVVFATWYGTWTICCCGMICCWICWGGRICCWAITWLPKLTLLLFTMFICWTTGIGCWFTIGWTPLTWDWDCWFGISPCWIATLRGTG